MERLKLFWLINPNIEEVIIPTLPTNMPYEEWTVRYYDRYLSTFELTQKGLFTGLEARSWDIYNDNYIILHVDNIRNIQLVTYIGIYQIDDNETEYLSGGLHRYYHVDNVTPMGLNQYRFDIHLDAWGTFYYESKIDCKKLLRCNYTYGENINCDSPSANFTKVLDTKNIRQSLLQSFSGQAEPVTVLAVIKFTNKTSSYEFPYIGLFNMREAVIQSDLQSALEEVQSINKYQVSGGSLSNAEILAIYAVPWGLPAERSSHKYVFSYGIRKINGYLCKPLVVENKWAMTETEFNPQLAAKSKIIEIGTKTQVIRTTALKRVNIILKWYMGQDYVKLTVRLGELEDEIDFTPSITATNVGYNSETALTTISNKLQTTAGIVSGLALTVGSIATGNPVGAVLGASQLVGTAASYAERNQPQSPMGGISNANAEINMVGDKTAGYYWFFIRYIGSDDQYTYTGRESLIKQKGAENIAYLEETFPVQYQLIKNTNQLLSDERRVYVAMETRVNYIPLLMAQEIERILAEGVYIREI